MGSENYLDTNSCLYVRS